MCLHLSPDIPRGPPEAKRADVVRFPVLGHIVPKEFASFARLFHLHPIRTEIALMREMTAFRTLTELLPCTTSLVRSQLGAHCLCMLRWPRLPDAPAP